MARQQNYGFDKRRKEQERKAKKDAKALERRQRREEGSAPPDPSVTNADIPATPQPPNEQL